jgi:diacylglycerol kinase (ATP)
VLIAGGDGTVHEVINGLLRTQLTAAQLPVVGTLPLGTGNDWARSLQLPREPRALAAAVVRRHVVAHDVGRIDCAGRDGPRWFVNVAGAGFDAHVVSRLAQGTPTRLTYLLAALRELPRYRSPAFVLQADAGPRVDGRWLLAFVANGRYCGHRMQVAPLARYDDGRLDVVTIDEVGLLRALPKLAKLYRGTLLGDPLVRHSTAASVQLDATPPAPVEADGQPVGRTPARFTVAPGALRVIVGD